MPRVNLESCLQCLSCKEENQNFFGAIFHIITITLVSMSMVGLPWFSVSGGVCLQQLTLGQFFWIGSPLSDMNPSDVECINSTLINMMRMTIVLCILVIILSLGGFLLDISIPKTNVNKLLVKYAIPATYTGSVILIMVIISISCYIVLVLEDSLEKMYPKVETDVTYGPGFYFISSAGVVSFFGMYHTLSMVQEPRRYCNDDDQCMIDAFDDTSTFEYLTPPPPYNIPPPPYSP